MSNPRVVWVMNENNSISLVLFNLRNRVHFLYENFPDGYSDFNEEAHISFLNQIREIENSLSRIYEWYYDLNRSTND